MITLITADCLMIHFSKQLTLDTDPKSIQLINLIGNLDRAGKKLIFFLLLKKQKKLL